MSSLDGFSLNTSLSVSGLLMSAGSRLKTDINKPINNNWKESLLHYNCPQFYKVPKPTPCNKTTPPTGLELTATDYKSRTNTHGTHHITFLFSSKIGIIFRNETNIWVERHLICIMGVNLLISKKNVQIGICNRYLPREQIEPVFVEPCTEQGGVWLYCL